MSNIKLGIICGGPSLERGISLNSARSAMDHIVDADITIYYMNPEKEVYLLDNQHLYSNTPQDFDFKIQSLAKKLSEAEWIFSMKRLDLIFPIIHGEFGEDGQLQAILEAANIPFIGSGYQACQQMFYKDKANSILQKNGYLTLPCCLIEGGNWLALLEQYNKVVIKPQAGGSSIGVSIIHTKAQGLKAIANAQDKKLICEAFCSWKEFTIIVLASPMGPVALVPVEIEIEEEGAFFDYRRKYLPTSNTRWLCPPRFNTSVIQEIQRQAEKIFTLFDMRDFVRLDGWVHEGKIIFSDINPISGMEQNSFIFLQASRIGLTHQALFSYIISNCSKRYNIPFYPTENKHHNKRAVAILFGGDTEERQVSLMSGTNVWLKLRHSSQFSPSPYFLDKDKQVWSLPYTYALMHTVEDIYDCLQSQYLIKTGMEKELPRIRKRLGLKECNIDQVYPDSNPILLESFIAMLSEEDIPLFSGLHGGFGENGSLQAICDQKNVSYNGSNTLVSALGMDKYAFANIVNAQGIPRITASKQFHLSNWEAHAKLNRFVIKPRSMGCSYGVQMIDNEESFNQYISNKDPKEHYIVEPFIETDILYYENNLLQIKENQGWLELTMVVCENESKYQALYPSITVAVNSILSLEEKFQGGTGVNITPPPTSLISSSALNSIQKRFELLSSSLGIGHYVRYDFFYNTKEDNIIVIEMNTLPALTPSTVLYHQMLASKFSASPMEGLEKLINMQLKIKQLAE